MSEKLIDPLSSLTMSHLSIGCLRMNVRKA
jgi:hypothetical protein